jgi:ABC-type multidrug transport system, ATPase and permease components
MGMNCDVYSYLLKTYGRRPRYWLGVLALVIQTLLLRVVTIILLARLVTSVAEGDFDSARSIIVLQAIVGITGLLLRLAKELLCVRAENETYGDLMVRYYKKLVGKDISFFRDHQTGYLASTFRQHADSSMELVRMFRGELIQTPITLTIPVTVMFIASWQVGLAALAVVIAQIFYVLWSSSLVNKERMRSHEIYRRISGLVSDDVTNIIAYKTSGTGEQSIQRLRVLANEETETFWQRRKKHALLDAPRDIITIVGSAIAYWMAAVSAESGAASVGLVVLTISYMFQIFQAVQGLPDLITRHDDLITKLHPTLEYLTDKHETNQKPRQPAQAARPQGGHRAIRRAFFISRRQWQSYASL